MCTIDENRIDSFSLPVNLNVVQVVPGMYCSQEFASNYPYASIFYRGVSRNGSPPWRPDDKDGHYIFAIGENLTSRCNPLLQLSLIFLF